MSTAFFIKVGDVLSHICTYQWHGHHSVITCLPHFQFCRQTISLSQFLILGMQLKIAGNSAPAVKCHFLSFLHRSWWWLQPLSLLTLFLHPKFCCDLFLYKCHCHHRIFIDVASGLCIELAIASYTTSCSLCNACFMVVVNGSKLTTRRLRR
jgi:hypothetical protein